MSPWELEQIEKVVEVIKSGGWMSLSLLALGAAWRHRKKIVGWVDARRGAAKVKHTVEEMALAYKVAREQVQALANTLRHGQLTELITRADKIAHVIKACKAAGGDELRDWTLDDWMPTVLSAYEDIRNAQLSDEAIARLERAVAASRVQYAEQQRRAATYEADMARVAEATDGAP